MADEAVGWGRKEQWTMESPTSKKRRAREAEEERARKEKEAAMMARCLCTIPPCGHSSNPEIVGTVIVCTKL